VSTTSTPTPTRAPSLSRRYAATLGVLAVGAALGVGHLVAGVVSPPSSPYLAVGNTVIRFAPAWLVEFAKTTFGTADKPVLLAGVGVVLLLVAVAAGLASRSQPRPAVVVVVVLGLLGIAAVMISPTFSPLDLLAPAAALATGVTVLRRLHALALDAAVPPRRPARGELSRRTMLAGSSAAVGFGALATGGIGQWLGGDAGGSRAAVTSRLASATLAERAPAIPASAAFPDLGTPTFLTANADFYRIDTALRIPNLTAANWSLRIHGMVDTEIRLTFDDLMARPLVERTVTMLCVSDEVGGDLISTTNFVGVDLRSILLEAGVRPDATQVLSTSSDSWTAGTPVDVIMEKDRGALLAVGMNGEALPPEHGFPVRMVVPGLYGYVSATKWVTDLELTTFEARSAYWVDRGWSSEGPIKTECRIDTPRADAGPKAGKVPVAGIAWSQPDGISKVEIQVDGGAWQTTELATEVSGDTWRMWRTVVDLPAGRHSIRARATNADGTTQTENAADPVPDGATGWPGIVVTVT
jgi:DMSO/TMAO reductase YedYZ molybdopterin-dependent catalytic subunit